ncbi:MAG: hypothetical protein Q6L68_03185 [Thermostichus sp. DG02_5_bins_236]
MQGSPSQQSNPNPSIRSLLLLVLVVGILSGCSEEPVSTVPLDGTAVGTRTATPEGQTFSDIQPGRDPRLKHLWASFVITPEQLQAARQAPITLNPQAILPCTDCDTIRWQPGSPTPTPPSRALGTYRPDQFTFSLQIQPNTTSTRLSATLQLDTTTPLIHPGEGVRLAVERAFLGEVALEPLPPPQDFNSGQITRGQLQEHTWILPFPLPDSNSTVPLLPLRLELLLTSPIPPDSAPFQRGKPLPPPSGKLYHAATWPGSPTRDQLFAYRQAIGQPPAWMEVAHRWDLHQDFPQQLANRIRESGSVPYLRLQLDPAQRSSIAAGEQDETLRSWAQGIQRFATPIILAVAVEDGDLQLQQRAYQHLMQTLRSDSNLIWVLELDGEDAEAVSTWATFGQKDWLSLHLSGDPSEFEEIYRRLTTLDPQVPLLLGGLDPSAEAAAAWLEGLENQQWPQVIGWSWSLSPEGIPSPAAQTWHQHLQQGEPWLGEMRVQPVHPSPSPTASPSP